PSPARADAGRLHVAAGHLPLDGGEVEARLAGRGWLALERRRTAAADHVNRVERIGAEAERPQQACRGNAGKDLAVVAAVSHLHLVVVAKRAAELRRRAGERLLDVLAGDRRIGRKRVLALRSEAD